MQYDDNGNIKNDGTRTIEYTAFNKPSRITKGSNIIDMTYGVDRSMTTKVFNRNESGSQVITTHTYIGGYEKITKSTGNGVTEHKFHIIGGNIVVTKRSNNTSQTYFMHKDTQGSVGLVTDMSLIATINGGIKAQYLYEPFGKQTSLHLDSVLDGVMYQAPSHQGYTGHHEMGAVDVIHMVGRIYDPTLGRFLQADPHIQAPSNSQNYNRYSYVLNNPMSYTDPSGFFFDKLFEKVNKALGDFAPIVAIGLAFIGQTWAAQGIWQAATLGFVGGGIATGSLRGALVGAFSGAAFFEIGAHFTGALEGGFGHVMAHGITGGISSVLQGGKFGHGFISAGLTKALNVNRMIGTAAKDASLRIITASVIGGTISKVSGGKFANGAVTAAFAQALNGERQAKREQKALETSIKYGELQDRVLKFAKDNPDSVIELSQEDLTVIKDTMTLLASGSTKYLPFSDEFNAQFGTFDTFLYDENLVSRTFSIDGQLDYGGNINYIGVGALFNEYGIPFAGAITGSALWNGYQYFDGQGNHNLTQTQDSLKWLHEGYYNARDMASRGVFIP